MLCLDAKPNAAHHTLAALERAGKLTAVVTQNIDGLHSDGQSGEGFADAPLNQQVCLCIERGG